MKTVCKKKKSDFNFVTGKSVVILSTKFLLHTFYRSCSNLIHGICPSPSGQQIMKLDFYLCLVLECVLLITVWHMLLPTAAFVFYEE